MVNEKSSAVGVNIQEKATMIWNVADVLRGPFKPHEYGLVILPMTVVKRFHDCLMPTHDAVIEQYEKVKKLAVIDGFLTRASGYQFYNTSRFTFESLLADPDNIEANFRDYLAGFSGNVQDVLAKFDFDNIIRRMPKMRFHDLRHSCASLLLANGVPLKQIQEWLGHSDFSTTANIYAHLDYRSKISSAQAMEQGMLLPRSDDFGSRWENVTEQGKITEPDLNPGF